MASPHLRRRHGRRLAQGLAAVEFALLLPVLLVMLLPLVDVVRVMRAQLVIVSVSREAANLASRFSLDYSPVRIVNVLSATASPPLNFPARGMIYITRVRAMLQGGVLRHYVYEQTRWAGGWLGAPGSRVWSCGQGGVGQFAASGECRDLPPAGAPGSPSVPLLAGRLADGDEVTVVEVLYDFDPLFGMLDLGAVSLPSAGGVLRAMSVY